jgi:hypothetical protein
MEMIFRAWKSTWLMGTGGSPARAAALFGGLQREVTLGIIYERFTNESLNNIMSE